jgi:hypothetical protein
MRTLFTALAFLVIMWAVVPAVRRSLALSQNKADSDDNQSYSQK